MGFSDIVNYVVFDNPLSSFGWRLVGGTTIPPPTPNVTVIMERIPLWKLAKEPGGFVQMAGIMGVVAVAAGAYGAHKTYPKDSEDKLKAIFETANRYHFYHTFALMCVPMCRNPKIAGTLFISGVILFTGPLYYHAFLGENGFAGLAPIGGVLLMMGWITMVIGCRTLHLFGKG